MKNKKEPKADLNKKRTMYLSLGLVLSLALVVSAFEWKSPVWEIVEITKEDIDDFPTILEVPEVEWKRPKPPKVAPKIVEVSDEEEIKEDIPFVFDPIDIGVIEISDPGTDLPIEVAEEIIDFAEVQPEPANGQTAFYKQLGNNLKYPKQAQRMRIEGKVFVQFVVDKDGSLTDIKVVKGIGAGCDEEAKRVVSESPKWKPGKQRGKPVKVRMTIPIVFRLH